MFKFSKTAFFKATYSNKIVLYDEAFGFDIYFKILYPQKLF